ncbi:MAG: transcription termination/antitermination NusG family protein [Pirellula sp.]
MPILCEETSIYPQDLLDAQENNSNWCWYLVYTRSRHEKFLARHLLSKSMSFYLPLVSKEHFTRGRRTHSYLPVFSGYLFYFGDAPSDVYKLAPACVSSVMPVTNEIQLVNELRGIQTLLSSGIQLTIEASLMPGNQVRVRSGCMSGLEGTVLKRKGRTRLLVAVNYLQQGVSIEIDDCMLEPI